MQFANAMEELTDATNELVVLFLKPSLLYRVETTKPLLHCTSHASEHGI
jgi:hypothetical protein